MKRSNVLSVVVTLLLFFIITAFISVQPGKGKNNHKGNQDQEKSQGKGNQGQKENQSKAKSPNNNNYSKSNDNHGNVHGKSGKGNKSRQSNDTHNHSNVHNKKLERGNSVHKYQVNNFHIKKAWRGNGNSFKLNGNRDMDINWNLVNFSNRWLPGDQKKITICHKPALDARNNSVTLNISKNALKAHLNHGDQMGNCNFDYSDRWSTDYIRSREYVYNVYEQTWERMSYGEALLRLAAEKLLGISSNLERNRSTLSADEIRQREVLIYELQNNMDSMDSQLVVTRQRLDSDVNIIIKL